MSATTFPRSPKVLKGALVTVASEGATPSVLAFQYNPGTLTRKLELAAVADGGPNAEVQRLMGVPVETINLEAELDATDALESGNAQAVEFGLHPQLAALEELVYPAASHTRDAQRLLDHGVLEIAPVEGPVTLFVWGARRVLPVKIIEMSVSEEQFDTNLNPIRAKVTLGLRVLSSNDLPSSHWAYSLFMAHQLGKERLANAAPTSSFGVTGATLDTE